MRKEKGTLFIISAPSGTGKSTVISDIMQKAGPLFFSVSATTRKPRPGEQNGIHYYFLTREQFEQMIHEDAFLEYAKYVDNYYGTPKEPIIKHLEKGENVILDIEVQGSQQVKAKMPEAVSIFIIPPSLEELGRRLRGRGTENEETVLQRLALAAEELKLSEQYDYVVVNDNVARAAEQIIDIMQKSKLY